MTEKPIFAISLLTLAISQTAYAENDKQTDDSPIVLEKVVVSEKAPTTGTLNKTTLTGPQLLQRQAQVQDTARLLEDIPGVTVQANDGVSSLPIIAV